MRPSLNIISDDLITKIVAEAKRILAETGMDIGGSNVNFVPGSSGLKILDHRSGDIRLADMLRLFRSDEQEMSSKPQSIFTITATGNFRYGDDSCQNLLDCVEAGIPIEVVPVTLMGLIAPVTLVGALVFHCVDVLTGLTMAQIIRPGHPARSSGPVIRFYLAEHRQLST